MTSEKRKSFIGFRSSLRVVIPVKTGIQKKFRIPTGFRIKFGMTIKQVQYLLMSIVIVFLTGCTCSGGRNRTDFELFHDMLKQKNIKAQEGNEEGTFMRVPPENTRARNREYYPYKNKPEEAGQKLKNPFSDQFSAELIGIGKRQYERACIYCHGATGGGEGKVAQKMTVKPPSLLTDKAIQYSDGRLYHIIHEGQGLMGSYRKQVRGEKERWALINYVRMLQKRTLSINKDVVIPETDVIPKTDVIPAKPSFRKKMSLLRQMSFLRQTSFRRRMEPRKKMIPETDVIPVKAGIQKKDDSEKKNSNSEGENN